MKHWHAVVGVNYFIILSISYTSPIQNLKKATDIKHQNRLKGNIVSFTQSVTFFYFVTERPRGWICRFPFRIPLTLHLYFIFSVSHRINSCNLFLPSVSDYLDFIWLCNNGVFSSSRLSRQAKQISDRCWSFCSGDLESWVTTALFKWAWINKQRSSAKQCALTRQRCVVQAPVLDSLLSIFILNRFLYGYHSFLFSFLRLALVLQSSGSNFTSF